MELLPALVVSLICTALHPAVVHLAGNTGLTTEITSMTSTEDTYCIIENDGKVATETTVSSQGALRIRVHLVLSGTNFAWGTQLQPMALDQYREEIAAMKRESLVTDSRPGFLATVINPKGETKVGSWDMAQESPDQAKLRGQLESVAHLRYAVALAYFGAGDQAEKSHNAAMAAEAFKAGVEEMGDTYQNPEVLDDSGMKLVAARSKEKSAGIEAAGPIYRRVLETRLSLYAAPRKLPSF